MSRNTTRLRYLGIHIADLQWIQTNIGTALERARRDAHPGIAANGRTADDGSSPGPTPQLVATSAISHDHVRQARDQLLAALDLIHHATQQATHAIHRLLPMNPADARRIAENETIDPTPLPCANPHCHDTAETNRTQCRACRAYRSRTGHNRPPELCTPDVSTTGHTQNPTGTGTLNA